MEKKINFYNEPDTLFLPLLVYFDDFEPFNVLGSKSGAYKIGAVYCKLLCLPPLIEAQLLHINPVMFFFSEDRKTFSDRTIFAPLIEELNHLQSNGVQYTFRQFKRIKLIPILIYGDNLGLNGILGFTESFNCNHYCRLCRISKAEAHFQTVEDISLWRTEKNYMEDVPLNNVSVTGIDELSVWNSLIRFHVTENYSVDIMHDLLEGVCHYDMAHIIIQLIHYGWFDLHTLNERIRTYNERSKNKNKFGFITQKMLEDKSFRSSAKEMLNFIESFPFIVDGLIEDEELPAWHFYIVLRQILAIVLSFSVEEETTDYLQVLIKEHHELYIQIFRDTLKPKHHFMLHYPTVIKMIGPIRQIWCMRFESKHQFFKNVSRITQNRKNLIQTFCIKLQLSFANLLLNYEDESLLPTIFGNDVPISNFSEKYSFRNLNLQGGTETLKVLPYIFHNNSTQFKENTCVQIHRNCPQLHESQFPYFLKIHDCFEILGKLYVAGEVLINNGFSRQYFGYTVDFSNEFILIPYESVVKKMYQVIQCIEYNVITNTK